MNIFKKTARIFSYVVIGLGFVGLVICCCHSDRLMITKYTLKNSKIDSSTFKAAVISDYHHRDLKFSNTNLIDEIKSLDKETDAIFFLGDLIDQHVKNLDDVNEIIKASLIITKNLYFVTGNHEEYAPLWPQLQKTFEGKVKILDNNYDDAFIGKKIRLFGLKDPRFDLHTYKNGRIEYGKSKEYLNALKPNIDKDNINILLSHRPELVDLYAQYDFDYILCGHTHGGQFRIGNWTPLDIAFKGQKTYPRGEYKVNNSTMIVSAGLGYAAMFPLRVNCNPEIVTITITK